MNDAWGFGQKTTKDCVEFIVYIFAVCCLITAILLGGCIFTKERVVAMRESMQYALIPAGTIFSARLEKDGPLVEMKLDRDVMVVDKGYLIKLQKDANRNALGIPD